MNCWIKDNLAADLSHSHLSPSPPPSTVTLPSSSSLDGSDYTLRTETPDLSSYYNPTSYTRPLSQMSYRSDDLQTIPSQDVSAGMILWYRVPSYWYEWRIDGLYFFSLMCLFHKIEQSSVHTCRLRYLLSSRIVLTFLSMHYCNKHHEFIS